MRVSDYPASSHPDTEHSLQRAVASTGRCLSTAPGGGTTCALRRHFDRLCLEAHQRAIDFITDDERITLGADRMSKLALYRSLRILRREEGRIRQRFVEGTCRIACICVNCGSLANESTGCAGPLDELTEIGRRVNFGPEVGEATSRSPLEMARHSDLAHYRETIDQYSFCHELKCVLVDSLRDHLSKFECPDQELSAATTPDTARCAPLETKPLNEGVWGVEELIEELERLQELLSEPESKIGPPIKPLSLLRWIQLTAGSPLSQGRVRGITGHVRTIADSVDVLFESSALESEADAQVWHEVCKLKIPYLRMMLREQSGILSAPAVDLLRELAATAREADLKGPRSNDLAWTCRRAVRDALRTLLDSRGAIEEIISNIRLQREQISQLAQDAERHVVDLSNSRERLLGAWLEVSRLLERAQPAGVIPPVRLAFLRRPWAQYLVLQRMRIPNDESSWSRASAVAEKCLSLCGGQDPSPSSEKVELGGKATEEIVRFGLMSVGYSADEAEALYRAVFLSTERTASETDPGSLVKEIGHDIDEAVLEYGTEVPKNTRGDGPISMEPKGEIEPGNLSMGALFSYQLSESAEQRVKLCWRGSLSRRYVFVTPAGTKAFEASEARVREMLRSGALKLSETLRPGPSTPGRRFRQAASEP
jgi:hypothetical protein